VDTTGRLELEAVTGEAEECEADIPLPGEGVDMLELRLNVQTRLLVMTGTDVKYPVEHGTEELPGAVTGELGVELAGTDALPGNDRYPVEHGTDELPGARTGELGVELAGADALPESEIHENEALLKGSEAVLRNVIVSVEGTVMVDVTTEEDAGRLMLVLYTVEVLPIVEAGETLTPVLYSDPL